MFLQNDKVIDFISECWAQHNKNSNNYTPLSTPNTPTPTKHRKWDKGQTFYTFAGEIIKDYNEIN